MIEEFEATVQYDPKIIHISFAQKNERGVIEIFARNKEDAIEFKQKIQAARRIYEMDAFKKQSFEVKCLEQNAVVEMSGNIFNAFKLLKETQLISSQLSEVIMASNKVIQFLESTKNVVVSEKVAQLNKSTSRSHVEAELQQKYAEALSKLGPEEMQQAMAELSKLLAQKGKDVEIKIEEQASPRKSPAVY